MSGAIESIPGTQAAYITEKNHPNSRESTERERLEQAQAARAAAEAEADPSLGSRVDTVV